MNEYTGKITIVFFQKDEFIIGSLQTDKEDIKFTGNMYGVGKGDELTIKGEWEKHPRYGDQLKVSEWERPMPKSRDQVISFLSSGFIKGVGEKRAVDIAETLGDDAIKIINERGVKALDGIKGIGKKTSKGIFESIKATFEVQEIISKLLSYGITANMTLKLYKEYGTDTIRIIKENPYRIMNLDGISFIKADEIARSMGIMATSGYRINACLKFVLGRICFSRGHSYIEKGLLINETLTALNKYISYEQHVLQEDLLQSIYSAGEEMFIIENKKVYPKFLFKYEDGLAQKLSRMEGSRGGGAMPSIEKYIKKYQKENKIILADKQRESIKKLLEQQVLILTGGPGTGKTTVVKAMLDIYREMYPDDIIRLAAPTGRASRKLQESTGYEAMTIHRMIGYKQGELPEYHDRNKLAGDLFIIDEFSMTDLQLAYWLMNAVSYDAKILFIGDIDQLPSVGIGNVLNDLISANVSVVRLTEIFRQAEKSQITMNAHRINEGKSLLIDTDKNDFYFIKQQNQVTISKLMVKSALRFKELGYSIEDMLILSPMRKGNVGIHKLNEMLRTALNPKSPNKKELKIGKRLFREGDKILQNTNNSEKDVFNGEFGIIKKITKEKNDSNKMIDVMICDFDGRKIKYFREDCIEIELGFAITIHKSQGGEAPIVIMPITIGHKIMLARNLYYTGITRAREKVILIGTEHAMNIAIQNNQVSKRNSQLDKRIINYREQLIESRQSS